MALVTVQRSPSPNASAEGEEADVLDTSESSLKSPRQRSFSENYFTVKGAALILPQSDFEAAYTRKPTKHHGGDEIQGHLQAMFSLLRPQDTIKVAVRLEGNHTRYLAVVSCIGRQDTEESVILGIDIVEKADVGLIIPLWAHTQLKLDGDGGFSITANNNIHCFKPVSVQAMWSALQSLNKVVTIATDKLYLPRGLTHTWVGYYEAKQTTNTLFISEWNKTSDIDNSYRDMNTPHNAEKAVSDKRESDGSSYEEMSSEESLKKTIKTELKNVMMSVDLEEVTCLFLRKAVEEKMGMDLKEHRSFIDKEMMAILGQMDAPSMILDYLYLGSEWNASNLEELQENGVNYILNISREIDNFFPGILHYYNIREWDVEGSNLQKYWDDTYKFIEKARKRGSKTLVHCKMGISRSASTVIAFLMKEKRWSLKEAYEFCKAKRSIINPNSGFWKQLEEYEGILRANWNRGVFNRDSDPPVLTSPDEKDEATVGVAQYFQSPEEFLSMKLGLGSETGEGFIHTEPDIDIASRSADSTEDSVPDNLSPDGAKPKRSRHRKSDKSASESGDYTGLSSDSSGFTDSEDLSTSDDDDDEDGKAFKPIDVPGVEIDVPSDEEKKKHLKDNRRSKSESDKASVTVDNNMTLTVETKGQAFSREGSQTRIRPDESWIKPESEDEESADTDAREPEEAKEENIVEDEDNPDIEQKTSKFYVDEEMEVENEVNETAVEPVVDVLEPVIDSDPYSRENIPWNPGTVKKQKDDIEEKFGNVIEKKDRSSSDTEKVQVVSNEEEKAYHAQPEIKVDMADESAEPMSCDISDKTEEASMDTSESKRDVEKSKDSLYAREEIDLPEGIVRKTTQEIEERSKLFLETPKKKLQRSSSLKSLRVTPKARDRDNERRRTCIAILSPTNQSQPDSPKFDSFKDVANSTLQDADQADMTLTDLGASEALVCQACGDTEEDVKMSSATVKVYKYLGEELTVQEGMVRKQKMDIEQNVWKPSNSEDDQISQEQIPGSALNEATVNTKQADPPCLIGSDSPDNVSDSVVQLTDIASKEEESMCSSIDSAPIQKVCVIKANLGDKAGDNKAESSSAQTSGRRPTLGKQESRFDPETLELIREIGSALLNSPAKPKMEQEDDSPPQGKGLVGHFVRQIEAASGIQKKKARKEIIVIDKDSEPGKDYGSKGVEQVCGIYGLQRASPSETAEKTKMQSQSDPVSKRNSFSKSKHCDIELPECPVETKSASPKWSPVLRTASLSKDDKISPSMLEEKGKLDLADLSLGLNSVRSESKTDSGNTSSQEDTTSEVCSVRNLVGKFEHNDSSSGKSTPVFGMSGLSSPNSSTQFFPGAKMDMEILDLERNSLPGAKLAASGAEASGQSTTQRRPILQHRRSEPVIKLSEKSLNLFDKNLAESASRVSDQDVLSEESESADSAISEGSVVRPKSAGQSHRQGRGRRSDTRRSNLRYSHTLPQSQTETEQTGRKVRKLYGRTHPLAKLEDQTYMDNLRSSPFYNTM